MPDPRAPTVAAIVPAAGGSGRMGTPKPLLEVRGLGVVGHQPLLQPGEEFNYTSWTRIGAPNGRMQGTYFCMTEDAHPFDTPIPPFELSMAQALH